MPFVNEYISPEDAATYRLAEVDAKVIGGNKSHDWTVDRDQDIYLRNLANGREQEFRHQGHWTFYWKGAVLTIRLDLLDGKGKPGHPGWSHWRLVSLNGSNGLPLALKRQKQAILDDLKMALVAYKDGGVFSKNTDYTITLELGDECVL